MLNYVWLTLILLGIIAALSTDIGNLLSDKFRNDTPIDVLYEFDNLPDKPGKELTGRLIVKTETLNQLYGIESDEKGESLYRAHVTFAENTEGYLQIELKGEIHFIWQEIAKGQGGEDEILGGKLLVLNRITDNLYEAQFIPDPVRFIAMQRVTNEGIVAYAGTAVTIAIGLIGIMALWLGIMKVAEEAGVIRAIARRLQPVMRRIFPDLPPDHPAMGAMILNISANMLGLANAATPLGLKAMEELNKLSKKAGTATDAMCTFLVINTSSVQLIPATVIAIRAASGSTNPTEIIIPMILATSASTIAGLITVKLLQRLPYYRKQLQGE